MKYLSLILLAWTTVFQAGQGLYVCKNAQVSLYSKAPIEDVEAATSKGNSVYNATTGDLAFSVAIRSFTFEKSLMQEHFNENYMESEKYPQASFKGKIQEQIDVNKDGSYPVNATGTLEVHGVKQQRTIPGTLVCKGGTVTITSEFLVKCADHQIAIPKLVFKNIAETIRLRVNAVYQPYKK